MGNVIRALLWILPFCKQLAGWKLIRADGEESYWAQQEVTTLWVQNFALAAEAAPLRRTLRVIAKSIIHHDPAYDGRFGPTLQAASVRLHKQLRVVTCRPWRLPKIRDRRGGFYDPTTRTLHFSEEGWQNSRVRYEFIAHACKRTRRVGPPQLYLCQYTILQGFRVSEDFAESAEEEKHQTERAMSILEDYCWERHHLNPCCPCRGFK